MRHGLLLAGVFVLSLNCGTVCAEDGSGLPSFEFEANEKPASTGADQQPIPLHRDPAKNEAASDSENTTGPSFGTILTALSVVVLLALGVAKLLGKSPAQPSSARTASPVDVIHRQNIDGKNGLCIVRVGSRLLVLSSSANGLSPLSEIIDPVEVEALTIELRAAKESSDGALGLVTRWLDRSHPEPEAVPPRPVSASDSVAGLTVREVEEGRRAG